MTLMAMLTAVALIVFIIETQIPLPLPIPGAKLGLANVVTLFALFFTQTQSTKVNTTVPMTALTTTDAFMILVSRIILSALFSGRFVAFIYSVAGGLLAFAAQAFTKKIVTTKQIWVCGSIGAIFHNIGQIIAAVFITGTPAIAVLLPQLIIIGMISGIITGHVAQFALERLNQ
jgi:heptaprenyl diphosphate synthase